MRLKCSENVCSDVQTENIITDIMNIFIAWVP